MENMGGGGMGPISDTGIGGSGRWKIALVRLVGGSGEGSRTGTSSL